MGSRSDGAKQVIDFLQNGWALTKSLPQHLGNGIKPVSKEGTAVSFVLPFSTPSTTTSPASGNWCTREHHEIHRGWIPRLGLPSPRRIQATELTVDLCTLTNPNTGNTIVIKDVIADAMLQQIITRPAEYSVLTTMNLNGDYISDALAARSAASPPEPTSATTRASPSSKPPTERLPSTPGKIKSTVPHPLGRDDAAPRAGRKPLTHRQHGRRHLNKTVTYDFERLMDDATLLSCSASAPP